MKRDRLPPLPSIARFALAWALCSSAFLAGVRPARAAQGANGDDGLSLKVLASQAPAGGVVQLTIGLSEPKPILTGIVTLTFDSIGPVTGAALFGSDGARSDASGTAVVRGGQVTVRAISPSAQLGDGAGLPVLTMGIAVPRDAPPGARGPLALDPAASLWLDPAGRPYGQRVKNGAFQIAGAVSIADVFPAGVLPSGSTITVKGVGFQPGARVSIEGVPVASTTFVGATEVAAVLAAPADLYGRTVTVRNPDRSQARSHAYLRGTALAPSARPLLAATVPIFSPQTFTSAYFANTAASGQFLAVAVQNPGTASADVAVELRSSTAARLASTAITLPAGTRISREASELFGPGAPPGAFLVVRSTTPVQVLGMVGDDAAGTVVPQIAALAFP